MLNGPSLFVNNVKTWRESVTMPFSRPAGDVQPLRCFILGFFWSGFDMMKVEASSGGRGPGIERTQKGGILFASPY